MELKDIIFKNENFPTPQKGDLLIAEPMLEEVFFKRGVVLLLEQDKDQGYIGLVMNKKTGLTMKDLISDWENGSRVPIYCGGPVESDRLFVVHRLKDIFPESLEIMPGIYVGADIERLCQYVDMGGEIEGKVRFFIGYSGWMKDQLESELKNNVWALTRSDDSLNLLEGEGEDYWDREVSDLGSNYRGWLIVPTNPNLN